MSPTHEIEFKLRAAGPLEVAAVDAALRELGASCRGSASLDHVDTYLDDERASLQRAGRGLRLRDAGGERTVTCKDRGHRDGDAFVRRETAVAWAAPTPPRHAAELPEPLRHHVEPFVLDRPLHPVLTLHTRRELRHLVRDGQDVCELAIDHVVAHEGGRSVHFHELELEVTGDAELTRALATQLAARLALQPAPDDKPTHARARLGVAVAAAATALPTTLGAAVAGVAEQLLLAVRDAEVAVRIAPDAAAVHGMRVAVRRLRSVVRTFREPWGEAVAAPLLEQLAEQGRSLGHVRDLDVIAEHVEAAAGELPDPLPAAAARFLAWLRSSREVAAGELHDRLVASATQRRNADLERLLGELDGTTPAATVPLAQAVREQLARTAARLRRMIRDLPAELPHEPLHAVRIQAKRLRYVAELFAGQAETDLDPALDRLVAVQQRLGEVCDHENATARLLGCIEPAAAADADGRLVAAALGALCARHAAAAGKARKRARRALARLDRKKVWRQLLGPADPDAKLANGDKTS